MPSGKDYGLLFTKYQFWTTFRQPKIFSYRKTKRKVSRLRSDHLGVFGVWHNVICPPAKTTAYRLQNINFEWCFGKLKNFPTVKINGRSPGGEVTIFGSFGAWGSVLCPPGKPTAYGLQNLNFERRYGNLKNFPTEKLNVQGSRPGNHHFGTIRNLRKRIMPSGLVSGLPFAKY